MKTFFMILILCLLTPAHAFALTASYEQTIYQNEEVVANFKITQQESHVRAESRIGDATTVILQNEEGNFTYFPDQNVGYKVPKGDAPNISEDIADYSGFLNRNQAVEVGKDTISGYDCTVYEFKDPVSGYDSKAWVWTEKSFPIQVEVYSPEGIIRVAFNEINLDIAPPPNTFSIPSGIEVMDMSAMVPPAPPANQ